MLEAGRRMEGEPGKSLSDRQTQGSEPKQMARSSLCAGHSCCVSGLFLALGGSPWRFK